LSGFSAPTAPAAAAGACIGAFPAWETTGLPTRAPRTKSAFRKLIETGEAHGAIAFEGDDPIGWCSYGPHASFAYFERSRMLPKPTKEVVWAVTCFFITRQARMQGVSTLLLRTACTDARKRGARYLEGYPSAAADGLAAAAFVNTGLPGPFQQSGFRPTDTAGARIVMSKRL